MTSKHPTPIHTYLACPLQGGGGLCYPGGPTQAHDLKFFTVDFLYKMPISIEYGPYRLTFLRAYDPAHPGIILFWASSAWYKWNCLGCFLSDGPLDALSAILWQRIIPHDMKAIYGNLYFQLKKKGLLPNEVFKEDPRDLKYYPFRSLTPMFGIYQDFF